MILAQSPWIAKDLDKRKEGVAETTQAHDINWSNPVVLRYHAQQNRCFSKAEVRKNMCMYLKNQGGYKHSHFRGMSYEDIRPIFERVWDQNQSFVPKDSEIEKEVKYPIIDWEVFTKESRSYWRIIRVGNHTEVYQVFEDMLKRFDRDDLEKLWDLVKKKFSSTEPTIDKEKRIYDDSFELKLYDTCGVHHVSTERGHDIFMLVEKDYPLTRALMTVMLANKLQVDESSEMANELLRKIFYQVNHKFRGGLLGIKVFYKVYTASST
ncbi:hypothetical protein Tco_1076850 [Tanacetum coccineum]